MAEHKPGLWWTLLVLAAFGCSAGNAQSSLDSRGPGEVSTDAPGTNDAQGTEDLVETAGPELVAETVEPPEPDIVTPPKPDIVVTPDVPEEEDEWVCEPSCANVECGSDGCGGECGVCEEGYDCINGLCGNCTEDEQCDDENPCTDNVCANWLCSYPDNEAPCDDLDACTDDDTCSEGECWGTEIDCDDGNECTVDDCDSDIGCHYEELTGTDCDDGKGGCYQGQCYTKVATCPAGWLMGQWEGLETPEKCYRPFAEGDEEKTWVAAEGFCAGFEGGHLVAIHSEAEQEFVKTVINDTTWTDDTNWIGLNDLEKESQWEWTDESEFDYDVWATGQPNNWTGCWWGECPENCVAIEDPVIGFGSWNDLDCDDEHRFVCQKPVAWVAQP